MDHMVLQQKRLRRGLTEMTSGGAVREQVSRRPPGGPGNPIALAAPSETDQPCRLRL
jgi:hypothetical protein